MVDTKSQIIEISRMLFAKHGFEGVSVRTICSEVGCNVSAISYYFGSKKELFLATLVVDAERRIKSAQSILTPPENLEDFKAKLKIYFNHFFEDSCRDSCTIRIIARDMRIIAEDENVHAYFEKIPNTVALFFKEAQERKILKSHFDARNVVDYIMSPYFMLILFAGERQSFDINDPLARQAFVEQHIDLLCNGFLV